MAAERTFSMRVNAERDDLLLAYLDERAAAGDTFRTVFLDLYARAGYGVSSADPGLPAGDAARAAPTAASPGFRLEDRIDANRVVLLLMGDGDGDPAAGTAAGGDAAGAGAADGGGEEGDTGDAGDGEGGE